MLTSIICLFGLALASQENYPEALPLLNMVQIEKVPKELHHKFFFYKTVTNYQLRNKEEAMSSSTLFFASFDKPPMRYAHLIYGIQDELNREAEPLRDIADKMGDVKRRLDKYKGGQATQKIQKEIVEDLAKLIKESEDAKQAQSDAKDKEDEKNGIKKKKVGETGLTPADESVIMGSVGKGTVDEKLLRNLAQEWGGLPPEKRAKIVQDITRDSPAKYKNTIDEYFRVLNKTYNFK